MRGDPLYRRGSFWLDFERNAAGEKVRESLYAYWYCKITRRIRRKSTGTSDIHLGIQELDALYLREARPDTATQSAYTVANALNDYNLEIGQKRVSSDAIKSRLAHVRRFLDIEESAGRPGLEMSPMDIDDGLIEKFRAWARLQPVVWKNAAGEITKSKMREESTIEEAVHQFKAVINHAVNKRRATAGAKISSRTRAQVTPPNRDRLQLDQIAELLQYTNDGAGSSRRDPLRRFIIASLCTLGRPDAIMDMGLASSRQQWERSDRIFHLNPIGRLQTKKYRASVGVVDLLDSWLNFIWREHQSLGPDTPPPIFCLVARQARGEH